ncbi:MAG: class I SAM-dependent methyltransferase [Vicinamibacterales bacterium]
MVTEPNQPLVTRLIAERAEAHRKYNEALTALDRAIQSSPSWPSPPTPYDEQKLPAINELWTIMPPGGPPRPAGWRGRIADAAWQLVAPVFERQMAFNAAIVDHLNRNAVPHREANQAIAAALPALREGFEGLVRFESLLIQFLQQLTPLADARGREMQDAIDELRHVADVAQRAAVMAKREVERVAAPVAAPPATAAVPAARAAIDPQKTEAFKYLGFEDRFRGSEQEIRARLSDYVPYFAGAADVLDVGCGRGEFLDLLKGAGVTARGLDLNPEMVEVCRARGLDAATGDALSVLRSQPDESLGGLIAVQVIEHLDPGYLSEFLQVAYYKLRPGSRMVLETINPACWVAFFESYIRDLTHVRPIHPETLQYMLHASGFSPVEIVYRAPIAEDARLQRVTPRPEHFQEAAADPLTELVSAFNRNMDRLNGRLFTFQDYAAVARAGGRS